MNLVYAPDRDLSGPLPRVFLAGSIEMGMAEDWQQKLIAATSDLEGTMLNPRRKDWDSSWKQVKENAQFREQVEWELRKLELANVIAMWFSPGTISPITLLELGIHVIGGKPLVVGCPEGFHRKGNVDITCDMYGVPIYEDWDSFVKVVRKKITHWHII